jgi:hypothetical protein
VYRPENIFPERFRYLDKYAAQEYLPFRLYSGHYLFRDCWRLPPGTHHITLLREPRERIISLYYFWRSLSVEAENPAARVAQTCASFEEFLTHPEARHSVRDNQFRSLAPVDTAGPEDVFDALSRFAFVGLREHYCLSTLMLAKKFGWPLPSRVHTRLDLTELRNHPNHQRRVEREEITDTARQLLDEHTTQDRRLYEYARRRFESEFRAEFLPSVPSSTPLELPLWCERLASGTPQETIAVPC